MHCIVYWLYLIYLYFMIIDWTELHIVKQMNKMTFLMLYGLQVYNYTKICSQIVFLTMELIDVSYDLKMKNENAL